MRLLGWIALAPLFVAIRRATPRFALGLGALWGIVAAYIVGQWLPRAVSTYFQQPALVGASFFVGVAGVMVSPYTLSFAAAYRALGRNPGITTPLLAGAAWTAAELARGRLLTGTPFLIGNPWALLGYSQVGLAPLVQVASLTGVYGITFALAAMSGGFAELWLAWSSGPPLRRVAAFGAALALAPAGAVLIYGTVTLRPEATAETGLRETRVAVVQQNLDLGSQWNADFYGRNLDVYLRATLDVIRRERPAVVYWPEGAMTFFLETEPLYRKAIASVLAPERVQLVAGGPTAVGVEVPTYRNSIFLLAPDATILGRYDKQYLVPFSEYFPIAGVDFLRRRFGRVRVFTPGDGSPPLLTAAGRAGVVVCNEAMLPEVVARRVADGATYLLNPSNDSWLDDRTYSDLQFDIVTLRAVEQQRYLVRASTSGPSAIVDPWGRVRAHTEPLTSGTIVGLVREHTGRTIYGSIGDAFGVACVVAVAIGLVAARRD